MRLPPYLPPSAQHASVAVGLSPLIVLVAFTGVVCRLLDPDTGFAWAVACTFWVSYEMHHFQRAMDAYNLAYAETHLAWRSSDTLRALTADDQVDGPTREFVRRFLDAGRQVLRDGQVL